MRRVRVYKVVLNGSRTIRIIAHLLRKGIIKTLTKLNVVFETTWKLL